jgi:carbohydrate diacid regulator
MVITEELAQKIVGTVMPVVHRNVNIMNREGIIIGTGQPERLGTFHKGALDAVESSSAIEIYPDELSRYPGARQGVNLPILLEGQIVGVVGVLGLPDEVRDTARMVKLVTELILEQELSQREAQARSRLREEFLEAALHHGGREVPPKVRRLARTMGINLEGRHCVCIVAIKPFREQALSECGATGLLEERMSELVENLLQQQGLVQSQDLLVLRDEQLIILREITDDAEPDKTMPAWLWQIHLVLSKACNGVITCAAGSVAQNAVEYPASYTQALFCLAHCSYQRPSRSLYDRELLVRYLASQVATGSAALALRLHANRFEAVAGERSYVKETLTALLAGNLDAGRAAEQLGIHRNSLAYRLQRIRDELDLDPVNRIADVLLCFALLEQHQ